MAQYSNLKAYIEEKIYENGTQAITGDILQDVLKVMTDDLGEFYQTGGVASPSTDPGTPDAKVIYIATEAGTYTNFGDITLEAGEVALLVFDTTWTKVELNVLSAANGGVKTANLADGAVTTEKIAGGAVETAKIANNAVTSGKVADGAIGTAKIADGAIDADKIAANAVESAKIKNGAVTEGKINDGAVTAGKIASNAVTTDKIKDDAVTSDKIANNAVGNDQLASGAVHAGNIADGAVTAPKIGGGAVTSGKIGSGAVTEEKIADGAVTSDKIANGAVGSDQLAEGAFSAENLADGSVTTDKLADDAVTAEKIADGAVTANKFANGSVTTIKLGSGAVTTEKIGDGMVTRQKLADSSVSTSKIIDGAVTTAKVADGNVTTAKIADANVTTGKLADGAVATAKIADGNVTGAKLQEGVRPVINVNALNEQTAAYGSAALARAAVPSALRILGLHIIYLLAGGWFEDEYIGSNVSGWGTASNWRAAGPVSVSQNTLTNEVKLSVGGEDVDIVSVNEQKAKFQNRPKALSNNGNLIIYDSIIEGSYYDLEDGHIIESASWDRTPLIDAKPSTMYAKNGVSIVVEFDENYGFLGYVAMATTSFTTNASTKYFACMFAPAYKDTCRINEGYTLNSYIKGESQFEKSQIKNLNTDFQNLSAGLRGAVCQEVFLGDYFVNSGVIQFYDGQLCYFIRVIKGEKVRVSVTASNSATIRFGYFENEPKLGSTATSYGQQSVTDFYDFIAPISGYFAFSFAPYVITAHTVTSFGAIDLLQEELENKVSAEIGKNKFNKDDDSIVTGYYLALDDGTPSPSSAFEYLYVVLKPNTSYTLSGFSNNAVVTFYNGDTYISGVAINLGTTNVFTTPANATKVGLSIRITDADSIQVEEGTTATPYSPYENGVNSDQINDGAVVYSKLGANVSAKKLMRVGTTRQYTSILAALKAGGENCRIVVDAGTYDIEAEYKAFYGNDFFSNYPMDGYHQHYDDLFYSGLYLANGVELIANGLVTIIFPYPDGLRVTDVPVAERTRENFDPVAQYFSIINTSENNVVDGIDISLVLNNCRYHVHDDFAYEAGMNIFRNMHLSGVSQKLTAFGCGMGTKNQYIIENCYINNGAGYSISYHNNSDAGKNKLIIKNVWCSGNIMARMYGASTEKTEVIVSGCKANAIVRDYVDQVTYPNENMELIAWNNNTNS